MAKFLNQHGSSLLISVLLHLVIVGMLAITVNFSKPQRPAARLAIEATVVDPSTLPAQRRQLEELERQRALAAEQERERQAAEARRRQELEARRLEEQKAEEERQLRIAEDKRKAEEAARQKAAEEKRKAEEAAKRKAEEEKRKTEAEAQRKREEEAKRKAAEEKARQEALLREELAREEELMALRQGPLMSQYAQQIKNRIERHWIRPVATAERLNCDLEVTQTRNGDVVDVRVLKCAQDAVVIRSLEAAALRATPLPEPPDPRLFSRVLILEF